MAAVPPAAPRPSCLRAWPIVATAIAVTACGVLAPGRFVSDRARPPPEAARAAAEASRH